MIKTLYICLSIVSSLLVFRPLEAQNIDLKILDNSGTVIEIRRFYKNDSIKCLFPMKNNLVNGTVKCFKKNGTLKTETNYVNGEKEGKQFRYYKKSTIVYSYVSGERDKIFHVINYHKNGKVKEEYNNKFFEGYGPYKLYYSNGKVKIEGQYTGIRRDGIWNFYNEDGTVRKTKTYTKTLVFSFRQFLSK